MRRQLGSTGWEETSPRSQREFILKSNAMERCQVPPFPCPMSHRHRYHSRCYCHQGQWSRSPPSQGVVLGEGDSSDQGVRGKKGQPRFLPPLKALNKKTQLGRSRSLFSQVMLHLSHKGLFLTSPRSMKAHQSYQKENLKDSSFQFSQEFSQEFSDSEGGTLNLPTQ